MSIRPLISCKRHPHRVRLGKVAAHAKAASAAPSKRMRSLQRTPLLHSASTEGLPNGLKGSSILQPCKTARAWSMALPKPQRRNTRGTSLPSDKNMHTSRTSALTEISNRRGDAMHPILQPLTPHPQKPGLEVSSGTNSPTSPPRRPTKALLFSEG